jgi:penicillin-binding protein 1C
MSGARKKVFLMSALLIALILAFTGYAIAPLLRPVVLPSSTKILDRNGGLLYELTAAEAARQTDVTYEELPTSLVQAIVASEDARFYTHHGIDVRATLRAMSELIWEGEIVSGGSTLEQQVVKNLYFTSEKRTFIHKAREMIAGVYWSLTHSKEETMTTYANVVFFGNRAVGVKAAAQTYFHKSLTDLSRAESALLVGIIPNPSQYDPYRRAKASRERKQEVLKRMREQSFISPEQEVEALASPVTLFELEQSIRAPHFVFNVLEQLQDRYPALERGGYTVHTTLDPQIQQLAEERLSQRVAQLENQSVTNGALMAMHPQTGEILAYVGSRNYFNERIDGQVDMVRAKRQPGSALKPFLFFQAFQQGFAPSTIIPDVPMRFETDEGKSYYPRNYGFRYHGPVSIREALGSSLNIPAVHVLSNIGVPTFAGVLSRFGINFPESSRHYGLSLVLGGGETSLMDVTAAYARLALYAKTVEPVAVSKVIDRSGRVVEEHPSVRHEPLFPKSPQAEQAAWLIKDILTDPQARLISFGESNPLEFGKAVAIKTGTTKDFRDNWAFGYTPSLVMGVWVGNADNTPMQGVSGVTGAVPILRDVMTSQLRFQKEIDWPMPTGLIKKRLCAPSGKLATPLCPRTRDDWFIAGTEPTQSDDWYKQMGIDRASGWIANAACSSQVMQKTYFQPPPEYDAWIASKGIERMPEKDCLGRVILSRPTQILSPLEGDQFNTAELLIQQVPTIPFIASGNQPVYRWRLNGRSIESATPTYLWNPSPGLYTLELEGSDRVIHFSVQ